MDSVEGAVLAPPSPYPPCEGATSTPVAPTPHADRWGAWDRFLEATPETGFMQSSWWADFRVAYGFEHFGAIFRDRNGIVGGALVLKFSYTPDCCFRGRESRPLVRQDS